MSPRTCLSLLLSLVLLGLFAAPLAAADQRPNFLFCMADDWAGGAHAGALGDKVIKTPTFDRLAREGVVFAHAYVPSPSCTPCRGGTLTGQAIHRLGAGGDLWCEFPQQLKVYPDILEAAGYFVGSERKGWGPGTHPGREEDPAGKKYKNFGQFLDSLPKDKPFCFWAGSSDPHRPYKWRSGVESGMDPQQVDVPDWLPDTPTVRTDICDYYLEVQRFDKEIGERIAMLEDRGLLDNTIVVMTGDNGMPFPRGKCNLYDSGVRAPFAVRWGAKCPGGRVVDDFVSFTDVAPTFLEAAGLKPLPEMSGRSFLNVLLSDKSGQVDPSRDKVFVERERHAVCRPDAQSYPSRAIHTHNFVYIRNLRPNLWPAGDPEEFRDVDGSPTKTEILENRNDPKMAFYFRLAFAKRPAEELYDLATDPEQVHNVAGQPKYAAVQKELREQLDRWMRETGDPRAQGETDIFDTATYTGRARKPGAAPQTKPEKRPKK